jgi:hypothetical protein
MTADERIPFTTLRFCGRMNAHISHDLKNVTATVSETAWLLQDLMDLQVSGGDVEPKRLKSLTERIVEEIRRGNDFLKSMNAFAHSTDEPERKVDLRSTVELVTDLARCLPFARTVTPDLGEEPVEIITRPYMVAEYCYLVFRAFFESMEPQDILTLRLLPLEDGGCRLELGPLPHAPAPSLAESTRSVAASLGGDSSFDPDSNCLALVLPSTTGAFA